MDAKVKAYIDAGKKIEKENKSLEEQSMEFSKREKLISLGLFSKGKTVYSDDYNDEAGDCEWDEQRQQWRYTEIIVPEVTEEEYAAILESEAIQKGEEKTKPIGPSAESPKENKRAAETYLEVCSVISLGLALIALIAGIYFAIVQESWNPFWIGFLVSDFYVAGWATLKVICNISNNLHDINEKTK